MGLQLVPPRRGTGHQAVRGHAHHCSRCVTMFLLPSAHPAPCFDGCLRPVSWPLSACAHLTSTPSLHPAHTLSTNARRAACPCEHSYVPAVTVRALFPSTNVLLGTHLNTSIATAVQTCMRH
jgi:hypothetical protein